MTGGGVLVTVGTTKFEKLISEIEKKEFGEALLSLGYTSLRVQYGRGKEPSFHHLSEMGIEVESYTLKPSLREDFEASSLIISHAGAGSCLEALGLNKKLLVVINDELMHNHQSELAEELAKNNHLVATTCSNFLSNLCGDSLSNTSPFPSRDIHLFGDLMNEEMGFGRR